jgi:hypothetical protein
VIADLRGLKVQGVPKVSEVNLVSKVPKARRDRRAPRVIVGLLEIRATKVPKDCKGHAALLGQLARKERTGLSVLVGRGERVEVVELLVRKE